MQLTFREEDHTYWLGLQRIPSVTEILHAVGLMPDYSFVDEWYSERGRAVHAAIALDIKGELDEETVDPEVWPHLQNARHALEVLGLSGNRGAALMLGASIEVPRFHREAGYAGTADVQFVTEDHCNGITIDWKCGEVLPVHDLQVAAYARLISANLKTSFVIGLGGPLPAIRKLDANQGYRANKDFDLALSMYRLRERFGTLPKLPDPQEAA